MEEETYPVKPMNRSLFVNYEDDIVKQLWNGVISNNIDILEINVLFIRLQFSNNIH